MKILAIDPGPVESAWLIYDTGTQTVGDKAKNGNEGILRIIEKHREYYIGTPLGATHLVIEKIASFGMPVGAEIFETVFWSGRFAEAWGGEFDRLTRIQIKNHLCHSSRAKDANIRQALIDRFGGLRGIAIGCKAQPGPLYGITKDLWSALAVAVTYADLHT